MKLIVPAGQTASTLYDSNGVTCTPNPDGTLNTTTVGLTLVALEAGYLPDFRGTLLAPFQPFFNRSLPSGLIPVVLG